ncbi:ESX-1 secretion-associated protein [Amycolatopsis sp. NBC_00345]|uniref:WXG100 family type VII secretion target n=1 Tax=Amycolatopsis sp. NBC_00345 TaxID=2975955 RepID=UPI002E259517
MTYGTLDGTLPPPADDKPKGPFTSPGDQTPPDPGHQWIPTGDVGTPPTVPGGSEHPGKGVTTVNTKAMRTFADNMRTLADGPLSKIPGDLDAVNIKPGVFATAHDKLIQPIVGEGGLRDTTRTTVQDLVTALNDAADAVTKAANAYENADEANKMTTDEYNQYFGQLSSEITGAGQKRS